MKQLLAYLFQYRISHMVELVGNSRLDPLPCVESLAGKTAVITGATSGIGLETARLFAAKGAALVCVNRSPEKSLLLEAELKERWGAAVTTVICDFSSLDQVRWASAELNDLHDPIDIFIPNAGVYYTRNTTTPDGIETVFQVNHLAPFMMTWLLMDRLRAEGRARIVYVNSEGHRFALGGIHLDDLAWQHHRYTGLKSYGAAKTAQLLTMRKFQQLFDGTGVTVNAMHPGNVRTNIGAQNGEAYLRFKEKYILKNALEPEVSAQALYYLSAAPELEGKSGRFFNLTTEERPAPHAADEHQVGPVWQKSLELCGLL
ncbi:MAG: SDR family NAD(P)-dependent oxidoreductase [Spirochaetales bacterium]|nr:SDR family NAD(P)-dependent oxidoreductase [Spirochaetales bacterium]